ncbi:alpha/beta-hydrolase, partial [Cadophora sp. DSE1049]
TVLLLHGHGDLSLAWRDAIPVFTVSGIRCIVPDLLGFGNTSKPIAMETYKAKPMCNDMVELLSNAGIEDNQQKVAIVSHDWGTHLGSRLVLHYPHRFSACVLVSAPYMPPFPQKIGLGEWTKILPNFSYWEFFSSDKCPALLREKIALFWNSTVRAGNELAVPMSELEGILTAGKSSSERPAMWDKATYDAYTNAYLRGGWEAPMTWYKAFFENFNDEETFIHAPRIQHPFLLVVGENDPAIPVEVAKSSEQYLASATVMSLPAGHWIPQELGAELATTVIEWL